jgi:hypothetical protein
MTIIWDILGIIIVWAGLAVIFGCAIGEMFRRHRKKKNTKLKFKEKKLYSDKQEDENESKQGS